MSIALSVMKNGSIVIAADTQESFGDRKVFRNNHRSVKITQIGSSYIATTGWGLYENILQDYCSRIPAPRLRNEREVFAFFVKFWKQLRRRYSFVNDQSDAENKSPFADLDSAFLVVNRSGIFHVAGNMNVTCFKEYYAIGSGSAYALGAAYALYRSKPSAEQIAREACRAAMSFDIYCGGDLDLIKL